MEDTFNNFVKHGKNNVDDIVKWMKRAKLVDDKFTEEQAKKLFEGVDQTKIEYSKFKDVLEEVARARGINVNDIHTSLLEEGKRVLGALKDGFSAITHAFKKD